MNRSSPFSLALLSAALLGAGILSGCATPSSHDAATPLHQEASAVAKKRGAVPLQLAGSPRIVESSDAYMPVETRKVSDNPWLRSKKVDIRVGDGPVALAEVLRGLSRQGITVTSELPLDRFSYSGFSLTKVDAETALRAILSSVGLDYAADASRQLVVIKPLAARTWYLNIGNRRSSYASGTASGGSAPMPGTESLSSVSAGSSGESGQGGSSATQSTGSSSISSADDFWGSLRTELDARMKVMLPEAPRAGSAVAAASPLTLPPLLPPQLAAAQVPGQAAPAVAVPANGAGRPGAVPSPMATSLPALPVPAAAGGSANDGMNYVAKTVGSYSVNPETGAVTVQAPHWVLTELDAYFKRVQDMYNTDIVFNGELVMLTTDATRSEGLDISAFARFASSRYGLAFANNALGGLTLSMPGGGNNIPSISTGPNGPAGPLLGLVSPADGLSLFNAYLTNLGNVTTLQKPVLTTTSGVPADFRRTVTRFFNTVSQEAATGGTGSAAVGTKNTLIAQDFGTILRVNPRIDVSTGLIRAQIELVQTSQAGVQNVAQSLSSGTSVQQVSTPLPIVSKIIYSGEALLRDGDLVVMGGQTEDSQSASRDGVTNLMENEAVGGVFGTSKRKTEQNVFYFALRVSVNKR